MQNIQTITYIFLSIVISLGIVGTISAETLDSPNRDEVTQSHTNDNVEQAAAGNQIGEVLKTHACPIHGYNLIIARPAGYSAGVSERVIQVEKTNRFFNATWNEVESLISNYLPHELEYNQLAQNPGPGGERFCNRDGYKIPTDLNVYQVSLAHYNDYTGQTSIFADNNLEAAPLVTVIQAYNQHKVFGDELPATCNYGCLDGSSGVVPDENSWDDMNFGEIDFSSSDPRNVMNDISDSVNPGAGGSDGPESSTEAIYQAISQDTIDPDTDPDQSEVEWQMGVDQGNEDNDQDENVSPRAQSHNSSRSNRTEGIAVDDADADGSIYCWGRGACVVSQESNIDDESSRGQLRINAREVRSWSEAEVSTFDGEINDEEVSSPRRAIMQYAIMQSQQDDRIQEMRINEDTLEMDYQARIRLFGFIPLKKNITGRIDAQGDTSITYPWYRFISGAPDTMRIRGLLTEGGGLLNI